MIEKGGHAFHISSTGPGNMAACTQDIKGSMISKMDTVRTQDLTNYLNTCNDKSVVIIPAKQLQESEYEFVGNKERHHIHLYNPKKRRFRHEPSNYVYFCNNLFKGINKHRFASERTKHYGPNGDYSTWFYIYVIDPETFNMLNFQSVGPGYYDKHFRKTDCPAKIISCFKVSYDGRNINSATFEKVYPN
jgi:hypothetical protein